jgi:hypothetical protein
MEEAFHLCKYVLEKNMAWYYLRFQTSPRGMYCTLEKSSDVGSKAAISLPMELLNHSGYMDPSSLCIV